MKKLFITSVVEHRMKEKREDVLARELFDIIRNDSKRFEILSQVVNNVEASDYLNYQMTRLVKYARNKEFDKFDYLSNVLLKNSKVYLVYSLNHAYPNWVSARFTKVKKLLKRVRLMALAETNTLEYSRVWIDKKPGDYGRPLGVPKMKDRIYGHMLTRIMETYLHGTQQITDNQHGGISSRGTLTFLRQLVKEFRLSERIFEFDIKGYFDHINHSSLLEMFESKVIKNYLEGTLKAKPVSFTMPPLEADKAAQVYQAELEDIQSQWDYVDETSQMIQDMIKSAPREDQEAYLISKYERMNAVPHPQPVDDLNQQDLLMLDAIITGKGSAKLADDGFYDFIPGEGFNPEPDPRDLIVGLEDSYKHGMEEGSFPEPNPLALFNLQLVRPSFSEKEREKGRETWKELDLENQGVPQGSSFGPLLASVVLGKIMPRKSLLYMDDGIVFLGKSRIKETEMISKINKRLSQIGCELSPEKSGILTTNKLWRQGLKIVGMRLKRTIFTGIDISSETRRGIKRPFFDFNEVNVERMIAGLYQKGFISLSKRKVLKWFIQKGKLDVINKTPLIELADKIGILGNILSVAYSPECTLEDMRRTIQEGVIKAELKMKASSGSIGERLINLGKVVMIETTEGKRPIRADLFNIRAISNDILLRYLNNELPRRELRIQGMRKRNTGILSKKAKK